MKKWMLIALALCLMVMLTGCKCKHEQTKIVGASEATCLAAGFTGNTVCLQCEEIVTPGTEIAAAGHKEGQPRSVVEATCTKEGYTGDIHCSVCDELLSEGSVVPMAEHTLTDRINVSEPTCSAEGYTGYVNCSVCDRTIEYGEYIEKLPHTPGEVVNIREATCTQQGYTGDLKCSVCDATIEKGESTEKLPHTPGELVKAVEPTCTKTGYSGDLTCAVCTKVYEKGQKLEKTEHPYGEPTDVIEVTCQYDGYTGNFPCTACNNVKKGEVIPKIAHAFENGVCTMCGWREPGLYIDGVKQFTWEQMIENAYVKISTGYYGTRLESVAPSLYGELIISEDITILGAKALKETNLSLVWTPYACTEWYESAFINSTTLEEVRFFGPGKSVGSQIFENCTALKTVILPDTIKTISSSAFEGCTALESIDLPNSLTTVSGYTFKNCTALKEVELPEGLKEIEFDAFKNCTALDALNIPDTVTTIGKGAFENSGLKELVMPAALKSLAPLENMPALVKVDMSKCTVMTELGENAFGNNPVLEEIIFSDAIETMHSAALRNDTALKRLDLPESFLDVKVYYNQNMFETLTGVTEIVWPVSLTDGSDLAVLSNVQTIYYRGTELQWNLTASRDMFPNAEIVFDYAD